MQILFTIHGELDPNTGAPGGTLKLGQEYQKLGHQVTYYSFDDLPDWVTGKAKSMLFPWFLTNHLSKLLKQQKIDVVDASTGDAWVWANMFRNSKQKTPLLVTRSWGLEHIVDRELREEARLGNIDLSLQYNFYGGGFRLWEVSNSLRCGDLVLQLNHYDNEYSIEKLGVSSDRSHVMPIGIPDFFLNLPFEPMSTSEDANIGIAIVGTYIPRKGIKYSVPALNTILERYPKVKVSFLGTGVSEDRVLADFEPNVRDRVRVIPYYIHENLPVFLKEHQIKLFTSVSEGFGLALIEAMACGLTSVTTDIPGPTEFVRDGCEGILVPPRDTQAIELALDRLIQNRSYLEQLRHQAYLTAQNYSWNRIAQLTLSLYQEMLDKKN